MHMMIVLAAFALVAVTPFLDTSGPRDESSAFSDEASAPIDEADERD